MINSFRGLLPPVLFGMLVVVALASVLVVTHWFQSDMALTYGTGGSGGSGGSGGLLVCPPYCTADVDEEEAALAENATTMMMTNQTAGENMTGTNSTN
jgi:hypothetical protein